MTLVTLFKLPANVGEDDNVLNVDKVDDEHDVAPAGRTAVCLL